MYLRDLHEPQDERLEQAARAILAAIYDPLTTQAGWGDIDRLNRASYDRLMRITALAVANFKAQTPPGVVPSGYVQEIDSTIFNPTASHREPVRQ